MKANPGAAPGSVGFPAILGLLILAIFTVDTFLVLRDAIAVLYVLVVIVSAKFLHQRGLLLVVLLCCAATVLTYLINYGASFENDALVRLIVSLFAIITAAILVLHNISIIEQFRKQAQLIDLSGDAILTRDMDYRVTSWNHGAEVIYGLSAKDVIGTTASDLLQTITDEPPDEIAAKLLRDGSWEGHIVRTGRDGRAIHLAARCSIIEDDHGRPASIMETNTDITGQHFAEQRLQEARSELAHFSRVTTLGEFTASIAHEVNQPLAAVVTNGEVCLRLLDRETLDSKEIRDAVKDIVNSGRRASEIIKRLRALFDRGGAQTATSLDMDLLIREVIPLVQAQLVKMQASLRLELSGALPPVVGDRVELQQVIINLLLNAAEAMEAIIERPREIVVRTRLDGHNAVHVSVEDTGDGIDSESISTIFKPFHTTKPGGMGMGLPICRSIVEDHGGKLWAINNATRGATFQFTLPLLHEVKR